VFTRSLTAVLVGVTLVTGLQIWTSRTGGPAEAAEAIQRRSGDSVLVVDSAQPSPERIGAFVARLPAGSTVLALRTEDGYEGGDVTLTGSCEAVRAVGGSCAAAGGKLPMGVTAGESLLAWYGTDTKITVGPVTQTPRSLVVVAPPGHKNDVKRAAHATLLTPEAGTPGETWLLGRHGTEVEAGWLWLLAAAGFGYLLAATALQNARDVLRRGAAWSAVRHSASAVGAGVVVAAWLGSLLVAVLPQAAFPVEAVLAAAAVSTVLIPLAGHLNRARTGVRAAGPG
jgi:hypothetical protein